MTLLRNLAANLVRATHLAIMLFIMFGWALPWRTAWAVHFIFTPLTRAHWIFNDRTCIFTTWENRIRGVELAEEHEEGWFVKEMVEAVSGWRPPTRLTRQVMAWWMYAVTTVSALRLAFA